MQETVVKIYIGWHNIKQCALLVFKVLQKQRILRHFNIKMSRLNNNYSRSVHDARRQACIKLCNCARGECIQKVPAPPPPSLTPRSGPGGGRSAAWSHAITFSAASSLNARIMINTARACTSTSAALAASFAALCSLLNTIITFVISNYI